MAKVGLRKVHYAILTQDDASGLVYGTVKAGPGAVTAKIKPKTNADTLYADDGPAETQTVTGEIDVDIELADLPVEMQADLLGHTIDGNGVLVKKSSDVAPYVALGFISEKSSGKDMYVWFVKGKFQIPAEDYQTKSDKPNFGTDTITGTFVRREFDQTFQAIGDEDNATFQGGATWFDSVFGATSDSTAPTVTTTPADAATGVAANTTVVWTFSEAIQPAGVTKANFMVVKATDGTVVAGNLVLSADQKTVTFTPGAALAATTEYMATVTSNVKDLAGNALANDNVTNFTTA